MKLFLGCHTIETIEQFNKINYVKKESKYSKHSCEKDMQLLLKALSDADLFGEVPGQKHRYFPKILPTHLKEWMDKQLKKHI